MKEKRTYNGSIEIRQAEDGSESRTIEGHAAVFEQLSQEMGFFEPWVEVIERGAFDSVLDQDVRALFNHGPDSILGRTTAGTLTLSINERGLYYKIDSPNTTVANDLRESIRRKDITQSSFAFRVANGGAYWEERSDGMAVRHITKIEQLFDVSPVTYPAYEGTDVARRSLDEFRAEQGKVEAEDKAEETKTEDAEREALDAQQKAHNEHLTDIYTKIDKLNDSILTNPERGKNQTP